MNNSTKGALFSGLAFPGLGHIALKRHKRGISLILTTLVSLVVIVVKSVQQAFTSLEKIMSEGREISIRTILNADRQESSASDSFVFNLLFILIIACWVIGVVDAYRIGKKMDLEVQSAGRVSNGEDN